MNTVIPGVSTVFEDKQVIVIDKPAGLLSQPGKTVADSVLSRVREACVDATGPMLVHRLDMDTSGLLILAKDRLSHRHLQQQFEHRHVGKRYQALLMREPLGLGGLIELPLRLDINNRPKQIVCYEQGRSAITIWRRNLRCGPCAIALYPITGRTHQLRVHLADPHSLGIPIQGDRLYGGAEHVNEIDRMMLHAESIAFNHPKTGKRLTLQCPAPFMKTV